MSEPRAACKERFCNIHRYSSKLERRVYADGRVHWYTRQDDCGETGRWHQIDALTADQFMRSGEFITDSGKDDHRAAREKLASERGVSAFML